LWQIIKNRYPYLIKQEALFCIATGDKQYFVYKSIRKHYIWVLLVTNEYICDVRYYLRIKTMFSSSYLQFFYVFFYVICVCLCIVVCFCCCLSSACVLCTQCCQFLWIVHCLIAPSVFSNVYIQYMYIAWKFIIYLWFDLIWFIVSNATFSNISAISFVLSMQTGR
jgi:hypothetical protein